MGMLKEFKDFAMKGNVVDMAVGIIIGAAFGKIVSSLVTDVIMPPIGVLMGNVDFSSLAITIKEASGNLAQVTTILRERPTEFSVLSGDEAEEVLTLLRDDAARNYDHYAAMLNEDADGKPIAPGRQGLARELARMNLTLNTYTQWYWKTDLHNLFNFLSLRADAHAQYEIRVYAEAMLASVDAWVPLAARAFRDYRLGAATLSAGMVEVVKRMLAGETVTRPDSGLNPREWSELMGVLGRSP